VPILAVDFIGMNYLAKPFDNLKIRQAFALALNKSVLEHNVAKDSGIATNHIVPQGMSSYDSKLIEPLGVKGVSGDQAKAKAMFTQGHR
jgi:oligopeptide transport system substrate-binding protein